METIHYIPGIPLSEAEGFAIIEAQLQSGLVGKLFAKGIGMNDKTFYKWRKRYLEVHGGSVPTAEVHPEACQLIPIRLLDAPCTVLSHSVEVRYPNGVVLILPAQVSLQISQLEELLKIRV